MAHIRPPAAKPKKGAKPGGAPPPRGNGFCIDKWEAHLVFEADGARWLHLPNLRPRDGVTYLASSAPGVLPQGYVNRPESSAACKAAGKRLCTKGEWSRACRGRENRLYPYGHKGRRGVCNSGKAHLLGKKYGANPRAWTYKAFNDPDLNVEPGFLEPTGSREGCVSPEGVFDLVGGLHEWVSGDVTRAFFEAMQAEPVERKDQPWKVGNGIFLGGFFSTTDEHGAGCAFVTIAHEPRYHDYSMGFRCCATPTQSK